MKSLFSLSDQFSHTPKQRRPTLDIWVSERNAVAVPEPFRTERVLPVRTSLVMDKRGLDGARSGKRAFLFQLKERSFRDLFWRLWRKSELYFRRVKRVIVRYTPSIAPHKLLYGSLVGGIAFGMVSMAFMEHFFGPGVFASSQDSEQTAVEPQVAGATAPEENINAEQPYDSGSDIVFEYFNEAADAEYKDNVKKLVAGYPIEEMLPYIFEQEHIVVAFLIGIAKKESNWGKRVPVLNGQDCFNYWGYRGIRRMMGSGGHTCFNSREDAVETVAKRLDTLINSQKLNTPEKMIIWKCGFSCSGHSRESVKKWISDVDRYFPELSDE
jgi:hypothetical protein